MPTRLLIAFCLVALLPTGRVHAEEKAPYTADWESLSRHNEAPAWFRDAKYGIYFHWGVYSVPAHGSEWYPRNMHLKNRGEYRHHVDTYGDPSEYGYDKFVPQFKAEKFDADEWAELFQQSGARFAGPVAEHHDGFAMWASKRTPWNAKDMGPRRDITAELAEAVRKRGMRFVTTFHHARNNLWQKDGKWTGHYEFAKKDFPTVLDDPQRAILYGYLPRDQFLEMWKGKLAEVIDNYQPDLIWFDSWLDQIPDEVKTEFLAYYFNQARQWDKDVVVTFKQRDLPLDVGVEDFEKGRADRLTEHTWLTDDTISKGSWCYTKDLRIKSTREVLHVLIDIVSKNGQLLLNISPKADGTIPEDQREVLLGIGAWLDKNGEAIYESRPWVVFGEGPTRMQRGGGFVGSVTYNERDVRFTTRGDTLYATMLGHPQTSVTITSLATDRGLCGGRVDKVTLLGADGDIEFTQDEQGLHVTMPDQFPAEHAVAWKIEGLKIAGFEPDRSIRFQDGSATLGAAEAQLHGPGIATENKEEGKANIGFWDDASAWVSWEVRFPQAGEYQISGRFASLQQGEFEISVGDATLRGKPPITGDWAKFETAALGKISVRQPGKQVLKLKPVKDGWAAMNLSSLVLQSAP